MLTVGSLFAGIGGIELGLERAGGGGHFKTVWQVEIDEYARRVLEKHWPGVRRWDDVRTFPPEGDWHCDIITGGDPCQENSGARFSDHTTQQSLGGEFLRVVDALRPRLVLRENPSHTRTDAPWSWWRIRAGLESLGYAVLPFRFRACCVGADHERERLFLLAEDTNPRSKRLEGGYGEGSRSVQPPSLQTLVEENDWPHVPGPGGYGSRNGIPGGVDRVKCIGNAVVPQVAEWIGNRILEHETTQE